MEQREDITATEKAKVDQVVLKSNFDQSNTDLDLTAKQIEDPSRKVKELNPEVIEEQKAIERIERSNRPSYSTDIEYIDSIRNRYNISGLSITISIPSGSQCIAVGKTQKFNVEPTTRFQIASLSKTVASAFAIEYFRSKKIPLTTSVNSLLDKASSTFRITSSGDPAWADKVTIRDLMSHSALNMHYVNGIRKGEPMPPILSLIQGSQEFGYLPVKVIAEPGTKFSYSGGGFLVLEHLIEALEKRPVRELVKPFLDKLKLSSLSLDPNENSGDEAYGYFDSGEPVKDGWLRFPGFAAGGWSNSGDMAKFLKHLATAYNDPEGCGPISHETAIEMLNGTDKGCKEFMACEMGVGIFTIRGGPNKFVLHQGANEGFRALFLHCYSGPDYGKGFVIFANGDNRAVLMIAEIARELLLHLKIEGIDHGRMSQNFDFKGIPQEQIVNLGYKYLIFDAFQA